MMKERLTNVLAWWGLVHALIIAFVIATGDDRRETALDPAMEAYFAMFLESSTLFLAFAPAVWMALCVPTGSPRFLPCRK